MQRERERGKTVLTTAKQQADDTKQVKGRTEESGLNKADPPYRELNTLPAGTMAREALHSVRAGPVQVLK